MLSFEDCRVRHLVIWSDIFKEALARFLAQTYQSYGCHIYCILQVECRFIGDHCNHLPNAYCLSGVRGRSTGKVVVFLPPPRLSTPYICISAGIFEHSMGARNRVFVHGLPAYGAYHGGIDSLESIPGLLKSLKISSQLMYDTHPYTLPSSMTVFRKENSPNILTKVLHWHDKL